MLLSLLGRGWDAAKLPTVCGTVPAARRCHTQNFSGPAVEGPSLKYLPNFPTPLHHQFRLFACPEIITLDLSQMPLDSSQQDLLGAFPSYLKPSHGFPSPTMHSLSA